jgi:ribosome-dependent ATPase
LSSPHGGGAPVARFDAVTHRYGASRALDDVSLSIPAGCMVGLIGPDAVGKSTLLGLLAGVRRLRQGRISVLGGDLADRRHRAGLRARIAYMPQGLGGNLYPELTVVENVDFFGRLFGLDSEARRARIAELLEATGLAPFPDRRERDLSGGMKQKLGLCCALVHDPELLILDEPTTGVDPLSRLQFWELVERMRARLPGMSVVVATAYMEEAERFDHLVLLDDGRVLADGPPAALEARAGATSLEAAYVAFLPEERRRGHHAFRVPPRPARSDEAAIEAEDLTRRFGPFTAVDRVSFRIGRGEIFGFLGPNGCGKSTTMKMLTGVLEPTEGRCRLFGRPVDSRDVETRRRLGYMSQSFSLYTELSVRQNLELHGHLFALSGAALAARVAELAALFDLEDALDQSAADVPLGVRQRLSLAVAVIHSPEVLILDEPTSGVDPVARDRFWELLAHLSRERGVTIFVSTHFMNEGARCDRIALMNAGRVLACDAPAALVAAQQAESLEEAFIALIRADAEAPAEPEDMAPVLALRTSQPAAGRRRLDLRRLLAYASREVRELRRDPIRLAMCFLAPLLLLVVLGYGISMDVEHLPYAALDRDRTPESRTFLEQLEGSRYFVERPPLTSARELEARLRDGDLRVAVEIPSGYGRDLRAGRAPEIGIWIDGAMPFRAETARGYLSAIEETYRGDLAAREGGVPPEPPARVVTRFRYNQELRSANAIVPGVVGLVLVLVPTMLMAVAVVREKELGSITNFQATPVSRLEFLLGKQLPYVAVSFAAFLELVAATVLLFGVPMKGSFPALAFGAFLYVWAATGLGLLLSAFTRTQIAAIVAATVLTILPTIEFSGLITPVSSLTGVAAVMGRGFPASWFNHVSVGVFTKALDARDLVGSYAVLAGFALAFTAASALLLRKQQA